MLAAFAPFFGALNWLLIPFAIVGVVVSAIVTGMAPEGTRGKSTAGLICSGIAAIFGLIRLITASYAKGSSLDKTVGRNSATVGWICIARCTTVYGAFAYMTSSNT